jgi:hypothetical protein
MNHREWISEIMRRAREVAEKADSLSWLAQGDCPMFDVYCAIGERIWALCRGPNGDCSSSGELARFAPAAAKHSLIVLLDLICAFAMCEWRGGAFRSDTLLSERDYREALKRLAALKLIELDAEGEAAAIKLGSRELLRAQRTDSEIALVRLMDFCKGGVKPYDDPLIAKAMEAVRHLQGRADELRIALGPVITKELKVTAIAPDSIPDSK